MQKAEEQLVPFDYHYAPHIFCSTAEPAWCKSWGERNTYKRNETFPKRKRPVNLYSQSEWNRSGNKDRVS